MPPRHFPLTEHKPLIEPYKFVVREMTAYTLPPHAMNISQFGCEMRTSKMMRSTILNCLAISDIDQCRKKTGAIPDNSVAKICVMFGKTIDAERWHSPCGVIRASARIVVVNNLQRMIEIDFSQRMHVNSEGAKRRVIIVAEPEKISVPSST